MHIVLEANTFLDYTNSLFMILALGTPTICFTILIVQKAKLYQMLDFTEELVSIRKNCSNKNLGGF